MVGFWYSYNQEVATWYWNQGQMWLQQMKMLFTVLLGLQLGKLLSVNLQISNYLHFNVFIIEITFMLTFLL